MRTPVAPSGRGRAESSAPSPGDRSPASTLTPRAVSSLGLGARVAHSAHCDLEELGGLCPGGRLRTPQAAHPGIYLDRKSPAREENANPRAAVQGRSSGLRRTLSQEVSVHRCPAPRTSPAPVAAAAAAAAAGLVVSSPLTADHCFPLTQANHPPSLHAVVNGRPFKFKSRGEPTPSAPPTSSLIGLGARRPPRLQKDWCTFSFGPPPRARKRALGRGAEVGTRRAVARKPWSWFPRRWFGGETRGWPCFVPQPLLAAVGGVGGERRGRFWGAAGPAHT